MAERGVYFEMMLEQWEKRFLEDNPQAVASAIASTESQIQEVLAAWPVVRQKFVASTSGRPRIYNVALERTRRFQAQNRRVKELAGQRGGKASAAKRKERRGLEASSATADVSNAVAKASDKTRQEEKRTDQTRSESVPVALSSGSKHPVFKGQRFVVFDWQLEGLIRLLGAHADGFDLHEWFFTLDTEAMRSGEVVPQRDNGAWLQARTLAEAKRRGFPIAEAPQLGKLSARMVALVEKSGREA